MDGELNKTFNDGYGGWSDPSEVSWIFDGRMDAWVQDREEAFASEFTDTHGHTFEADINLLAAEGFTAGCNPLTNDRFCPNDYVTRGAMQPSSTEPSAVDRGPEVPTSVDPSGILTSPE